MREHRWQVLVVEDNVELGTDVRREILDAFADDPDIDVEVTVDNDFDRGLETVAKGGTDIVVLDVRRDLPAVPPSDETAGRRVFHEIQAIRFLPVIFWTARPDQVLDREMRPLVRVLTKEQTALVPEAIKEAIQGEAPQVTSRIERRVAATMARIMWDEVGPNWSEYQGVGADDDDSVLAATLISQVARVLEDEVVTLSALPSRRYVFPPSSRLRPGDLFREVREGGGDDWWCLLTPACDLEHGKSELVLLSRARPLGDLDLFSQWQENTDSNTKWKALWEILKGKKPRYTYLPRFREVPDLLVDLEDVRTWRLGEIEQLKRIASLTSPYSEALLVRHSHFRGRVGVPDLVEDQVRASLTS